MLAAFSAASCQVKEEPVETPSDFIELLYEETRLEKHSEIKIPYEAAEGASVQFSSSDESVARVTADGTIVAVGKGSCIVLAKSGAAEDSCNIEVYLPSLQEIALAQSEARLLYTEKLPIEYSLLPEDAEHGEVIIESLDPDVAFIDENGSISAKSIGKTEIAISCGEIKTSLMLEVYADRAESFSLGTHFLSIAPGASRELNIDVRPLGYELGGLKWTSENEGIAYAEENGKICAVSTGLVRLTAEADGISHELFVSVTDKVPAKPLAAIPEARYKRQEDGSFKNTASEESGRASIMLTGDLMCLRVQQMEAKSGGAYNFNNSFKYVKALFEKADLVAGNLESCISYSWPLTIQEKDVGGYPNCNGPATYLDALRYAGFDLCVTANNHCCDANLKGILETTEMLDKYGIFHTGTFSSKEEARFVIADVNGIKVGFISYTEYFNGKHRALSESERNIHLNQYSAEKAKRDIAAAREAGAEFVIVYAHWGSENVTSSEGTQRQHAREIANAGADMIAGSHPHVLQEAAYIDTEDGRRVLCVYSMGNFVSSMGSTENNDTVIIELELERNEEGKVVLSKAGYIPARVYRPDDFAVTPAIPGLNGGKDMESVVSRIARVIGDEIDCIRE